MTDNIDKSKISYEKYLSMKSKLLIKSYTERFKFVDKFLYIFSWFGNTVSIFLAFFFMQTLFQSSFKGVSDSLFITIGIILFLSLFELLKRYILGLFSIELIKNQFNIFNKNMILFILSTLFLTLGSFYLSLNGASDFVNNQKVFEKETKNIVLSKVDSITNTYNTQLLSFKTENENLRFVNNGLRTKLTETSVNLVSVRNGYQKNIDKNTDIINSNQSTIDKIETEKKITISTVKSEEANNLNSTLNDNKSNMLAFIIISSIIELIIIIGIYFDKLYDFKTIIEYEKTVVETSTFKTWYLYNKILGVIYFGAKGVGERIPTTDYYLEALKINNIILSKTDFDKFMKILYVLEIVYLEGKRRILTKPEQEGKLLLKQYFKIN